MKKIACFALNQPSKAEEAALKTHFGKDTVVVHCGPIGNAAQGVEKYLQGGFDDLVVLAPESVLKEVLLALPEGVRPLYPHSVRESDPKKIDFRNSRGEGFRFVKFQRLMELKVVYAEKLKALQAETRPPHTVMWFSQHPPTQGSLLELQQLYGKDLRLQQDVRPFRDAREVIERMCGACDVVLVAPLSVFDALIKQGVQPIQAQLVDGQAVLRRVRGLRMEFADFD